MLLWRTPADLSSCSPTSQYHLKSPILESSSIFGVKELWEASSHRAYSSSLLAQHLLSSISFAVVLLWFISFLWGILFRFLSSHFSWISGGRGDKGVCVPSPIFLLLEKHRNGKSFKSFRKSCSDVDDRRKLIWNSEAHHEEKGLSLTLGAWGKK